MGISIDEVLEGVFSPFYKLGGLLAQHLSEYSSDMSKFLRRLAEFGMKIPTTCFFKRKFKLSFTPCKLNPFYPVLVAIASWARRESNMEFLFQSIYDDPRVGESASQQVWREEQERTQSLTDKAIIEYLDNIEQIYGENHGG